MGDKVNKTLCAYPWRSAAIRPNGATIPCCRYTNLTDEDSFVSSKNPRESTHWVELRDRMLAGEPSHGCRSCYQDERNGLLSMRLESLQKFIPINNEPKPIEQLEIAFSNLCNLACVHCGNYYSSKWNSEDFKMGREYNIVPVANEFHFDSWDLSNLQELKIIGGEPFMDHKKFIELLRNLDLSKISLQICTNGTVIPNEELQQLIESCERVYLCVSLDGLFSTNDWYRWPSKFSEVTENMRVFEQLWGHLDNIHFVVHHVVNAINVTQLSKFIEYIDNNFSKWEIEWDWIRWPIWQQLSSLPDELKDELVKEFSDKTELTFGKIVNPYKTTIERLRETAETDWDTGKGEIVRLSTERNLDHISMLPKEIL